MSRRARLVVLSCASLLFGVVLAAMLPTDSPVGVVFLLGGAFAGGYLLGLVERLL